MGVVPRRRLPDVGRTADLVSFRDFVDDALFHPDWGYYSTGEVRFGEGGHYETFPLALSPLYGQMVARCAFRFWQRCRQPQHFEICEIGAGNGQLCLDVLSYLHGTLPRATRPKTATWDRFAGAVAYRIIERSPALITRQRTQLGPLAAHVRWTRADLSTRPARGTPFAPHGFIIANEVLDCLAHHKIVTSRTGPGVVFVASRNARGTAVPLSRSELRRAMTQRASRTLPQFAEVVLPLSSVPGLDEFIRNECPELCSRRRSHVYFACPALATLIANSARLYTHSEAFWIDYGDERPFHLRTPERRRVFAGPPRSGRTVYDRPGKDDITFMVDFTLAQRAAHAAGLRVVSYGPQGDLVRLSGVRFDAQAQGLIAQARALTWLLALNTVGPEYDWRRAGFTWKRSAAKGESIATNVRRNIDELLGRRRSAFKLLVLRSDSGMMRSA